MLLEYIQNYYSAEADFGQNILTKYTNWVTELVIRESLLMARHEGFDGHESMGVRLLKHIIGTMDFEYLKKLNNDFERYTYYFKNVQRDAANLFDTNATGANHKEMFVKKGIYTTTEYIIPVECENPLASLPLGYSFDQWMSLKPVRIVDHDSEEFTLDVMQDRVKFKRDQPSYMVITIDPTMLAFMYYKFMEYNDFEDTMSIQVFMHKYVTIKFMDDLQDIWLRNQIINLLDIVDQKDIDTLIDRASIYDSRYGYVGLQYQNAMTSIWKVADKVRKGTTRPDVFLRSVQLSNKSLSTYLTDMLTTTHIPSLNQYMWQRYVRDMRWVELVTKVYQLNPAHSKSKQLARLLKIKVQTMERTRFWENIHGDITKNEVKDHFLAISSPWK